MKGKVKYLFLSLIGILVISLVVLSGCAGNDSAVLTFPAFEAPLPPPVEVTVDQLYQEYMTDETAAKAKYKGKRLLFTNVEVEEINRISVNSATPPINYIVNHSVEFLPRYATDFDYILVGFVVDIVGDCQGLSWGRVLINDCWINIVEGDIEADYGEPAY
jgi:hypothetical protein